MIQINNVTKIYKSKKSEQVIALDNLSLTFADTGMNIILGRSGCGKTTLLNILSGIDTVTSGDVIVNGIEISKIDPSKLDNYRNFHIAYIFQDFHLLSQLTVYENINIALHLSKAENSYAAVSACLHKVGLDGYENRKINELSGGEKQRVAIARAIIKSPKILLADEPTGNLDTKTGREIFELLKELSKDICVIVVTHDREFAEDYGEHFIELEDGKIIESRNFDNSNDTFSKQIDYMELPKKMGKLPASVVMKMGLSGVKYHPFRLIIIVILYAFAMAVFGFGMGAHFFYPLDDAIKLYQEERPKYTQLYNYDKYLKDPNPSLDYLDVIPYGREHLYDHRDLSTDLACVDESQLTALGFTMAIGSFPTAIDEIVIPDYNFNVLKEKGFVLPDGEIYYPENIASVKLPFYLDKDKSVKVVGIYNSDYNNAVYSEKPLAFRTYVWSLPTLVSKARIDVALNESVKASYNSVLGKAKVNLNLIQGDNFINEFSGYEENLYSTKDLDELGDKEIILTFDNFCEIFGNKYDVDTSDSKESVFRVVRDFSHFMTIPIVDDKGDIKFNANVVGFYDGQYDIIHTDTQVVDYKMVYLLLPDDDKIYERFASDALNIELKEIYPDWTVEDTVSIRLNASKGYVLEMTIVAGIIMGIIAILMMVNYISAGIYSRIYEIGTLKSMGARNTDIAYIFSAEAMLISIISIPVGLLVTHIANTVMNSFYKKEVLKAFGLRWQAVMVVLAVAVMILLISIVLPIFKLLRKKPIELINGK